MIKNQREFDFLKTLKSIEKQTYRRDFDEDKLNTNQMGSDPFLVTRTKDSDYENTVKVDKFEKAQENIGKDIGDGVIQRYIRTKGRNRELDKKVEEKKVIQYRPRTTVNRASLKMKEKDKQNYNSNQFNSNHLFKENHNMIGEKNNFNNSFTRDRDNESNKQTIDILNQDLSSSSFSNSQEENSQHQSQVKDFKGNNNFATQQNFAIIHNFNNNAHLNNPHSSKSKLPIKNIIEEKKVYTKPTTIRLVYKTRYNSSKKPNIAYCIINKEYVEPIVRNKAKEIQQDKYSALCTVQTVNRDSYEVYLMAGEAVKPYEFYANEIVVYIQKLYKLVLKTIVMDFTKDERGIIYFLGVKAFIPFKEPEDMTPEFNIHEYIKDEKNIKKIYKTWTCRLCGLSYPKAKITKVVTFKLLLNLKDNLAKRGKGIFNHIGNNSLNESMSCRVCDLCYKLLITEQELMEIQKTIAICNNIPVQSEEDLLKKKKIPENVIKIPQKLKVANQWRILFYFVRFYVRK
jgi:hypothetical protein